MWSDDYCHPLECGAWTNRFGPDKLANASCLYQRSLDDAFARSIGGITWPRGFVAAGALSLRRARTADGTGGWVQDRALCRLTRVPPPGMAVGASTMFHPTRVRPRLLRPSMHSPCGSRREDRLRVAPALAVTTSERTAIATWASRRSRPMVATARFADSPAGRSTPQPSKQYVASADLLR